MSERRQILVRVYVVYIVMALFGVGILARVLQVQFADGGELKEEADKLVYRHKTIEAPRGNIFASDEDKRALAISVPRYDIHMDPITVRQVDFDEGLDSLAIGLGKMFPSKTKEVWKDAIIEARRDSNQYFSIRRRIRYDELQELKGLPIFRKGKFKGGLIVEMTSDRVRPYGYLARRTIGFMVDGKATVGLEGYFDSYLRGQDGKQLVKKIGGNQWKPIEDEYEVDPLNGQDVYSTLDINLQDVAESALLKQLQDQKAMSGCAILMEVETGHIKAMANLSRLKNGGYGEIQNIAVGKKSNPGSTFKLASLMVMLDDGKIRITDSVDAVGKYTYFQGSKYESSLKDSRSWGYGRITVERAFELSSNVISKLAYDNYHQNPQAFVDGLKRIGVGEPLGVTITGESMPTLRDANHELFSGISVPWMSIGYEVEQSPLQTLALYNAVANNGKMVKPMLVSEIREGNRIIESFETEVLYEQIAKPSTIKIMRKALEGVVENGTAKNIRARGFKIAGKTGTVQLREKGRGSLKYQASFCGYFPADNPKYSCIVLIQGPTNNIYGSVVSGTVFKEIADKVYASSVKINQRPDAPELAENSLQPYVKYGKKSDLVAVLYAMDVKVSNHAKESEWVVSRSQEHSVKIENRKADLTVVPNVVGMGLVDALYLLENAGMYVSISGSGSVKAQSQRAGSELRKGSTIIIELK